MRAHGIQVTPLLLVSDDATYRDGVEITADDVRADVVAIELNAGDVCRAVGRDLGITDRTDSTSRTAVVHLRCQQLFRNEIAAAENLCQRR